MDGKMKLGSAGAKLDNQADTSRVLKKGKVQNVVPRPSKMAANRAVEPIGLGGNSRLKMKGMKGE